MPVTPEPPKQNTDIIGQKTYPITKENSIKPQRIHAYHGLSLH